jgi:hypothetical protein
MKVWLVWEDYLDERTLFGVFSNQEKADEAIKQLYEKYKEDLGDVWVEEWEVDEVKI